VAWFFRAVMLPPPCLVNVINRVFIPTKIVKNVVRLMKKIVKLVKNRACVRQFYRVTVFVRRRPSFRSYFCKNINRENRVRSNKKKPFK